MEASNLSVREILLADMPGINPLNAAQKRAELGLSDPGVRRLVFRAGNRLGKSSWLFHVIRGAMTGWYSCQRFAHAQGIDEKLCCESDHNQKCPICKGWSWCPVPAKVVVVSITKEQAAEALEGFIREFILSLPEPWESRRCERTKREGLTGYIKLSNGSTFRVRTSKQGARALQGFAANLVAPDEKIDKSAYQELAMRIPANTVMKMPFTFTPTDGRDWQAEEFEGASGTPPGMKIVSGAIWENGTAPCLTCGKDQAEWDTELRRQGLTRTAERHHQLIQLCRRCLTFGLESRYEQSWFEARYAEWDDWEVAMRAWGEYVNINATDFFSANEQKALVDYCQKPTGVQYGQRRYSPPLQIEHRKDWPLRRLHSKYVIGVDCAEGVGGDEAVFIGLDITTGEVAFTWGDHTRAPESYTEDLRELAKEFHAVSVCVEHERSGSVVCQALKYDPGVRLYRHRAADQRYAKEQGRIGFRTSGPSRYRVVRQLIRAIRRTFVHDPVTGDVTIKEGVRGGFYCRDRKTVEQIKTLYQDEDGKLQCSTKHDDRMMASAFAEEARRALQGHGDRQHADPLDEDDFDADAERSSYLRGLAQAMPDYQPPSEW